MLMMMMMMMMMTMMVGADPSHHRKGNDLSFSSQISLPQAGMGGGLQAGSPASKRGKLTGKRTDRRNALRFGGVFPRSAGVAMTDDSSRGSSIGGSAATAYHQHHDPHKSCIYIETRMTTTMQSCLRSDCHSISPAALYKGVSLHAHNVFGEE